MAEIDKPVFVDVDPLAIQNEMKVWFEDQLQKKLEPAQIEQLLINGWAYRESIIRNQINSSAVQNILRFATGIMLDLLGELFGVTRIPAVAATAQMTLSFGGNTIQTVIEEGTRIASTDQRVVFRTTEPVTIPANTSNVSVTAICDTEGVDGNGYVAGEISVIQDPAPYLVSATNSVTTIGGAPEESDDQLRERIKLAPSRFSTAGSTDAYRFWALTAHPSIVDVGVPEIPLVPGTVNIYPLIDSGDVTPTEILDAVQDVCSARTIRPLTDTVNVQSPTRMEYALDIQLTLFTGAIQSEVEAKVDENAAAFTLEKRRKLGRDIIREQLIAALMDTLKDSVYKITLVSFSDIVVPDNSFAFCTGIAVTTTGLNNG